MHITHVTPVIKGYGGIQRLLREVANRQVHRGHEVRVITVGTADDDYLPFDPEVHVIWLTVRQVAGRYSIPSGLRRVLSAPAWAQGVVHAHQAFALTTTLTALTGRAKAWSPYMHVQHWEGRLSVHRRALQLRLLASRYGAGTVFLCDTEREVFETFIGRSATAASVIPPGVAAPSSSPSYEKSEPVVLVVSRLVGYKQVDRVIAAARSTRVPSRLVIIGDGPERSALATACEDNGLDVSATLVGSVDDASLERWYRTADVVVALSREESFGLTLLEAASAGTPLVVSNIPAHRDALALVGTPSSIVNVDADAQTIALALDEMLTRPPPELAPNRSRSWDQTVDDLEQLYECLLRAHTD
jgi:glycosyltransferase involved in cell wall biosynthesis